MVATVPVDRGASVEFLELRHHRAREHPQIARRLLVRHAGVGEDADIGRIVGLLVYLDDLVIDLLGRAVDLQVGEELDRLLVAVDGELLVHLGVVLVAALVLHVLARELIVVEHGAVVAADVLDRHLARPLGAFVDEGPAGRDRLRRVTAVDLAIERVVLGQLLLDLAPRLLRDDEQADAEPRHDARAFGTDRGGIGAAAEALEGRRPDGDRRLLVVLALVFHDAALEALQQRLAVFDEQLAAVAHVEAEAVELDFARAAAETQDHAPARQMVEHGDLLRHPHRVVPRQHHHHRAQPHVLGAARHVRQELHHVGAHGVVGEMVLDRPDRFEPERLGHVGERQFVQVDLPVAERTAGILEDGGHSDVHGTFLWLIRRMVNGRLPPWEEGS